MVVEAVAMLQKILTETVVDEVTELGHAVADERVIKIKADPGEARQQEHRNL